MIARLYLFWILCLLLSVAATNAMAQFPEPKTYRHGMIYDDNIIKNLRLLVDSLHRRMNLPELQKNYAVLPQCRAYYVYLEQDLEEARQAMDKHMDFKQFVKKFNCINTKEDILVCKFSNHPAQSTEIYALTNGLNVKEPRLSVSLLPDSLPLKNSWVYQLQENEKGKKTSLAAFYFPEEFCPPQLASPYATMVQYARLLVDSSAPVYLGIGKEKWPKNSKVQYFLRQVNQVRDLPNEMSESDPNYRFIIQSTRDYQSSRNMEKLDEKMARKDELWLLFREAITEAVGSKSTDEFEFYVERYFSATAALLLKRQRIYILMCYTPGDPIFPDMHAHDIAVLAAKTAGSNWGLFMRAHFEIIRDRYSRSHQRHSRYLCELEEIGIDVVKLLIGLCLHVQNPPPNRAYVKANADFLAFILSETQYRDKTEEALFDMIADPQLDYYNRMLVYRFFVTYNDALKDSLRQQKNLARLKQLAVQLPGRL